MRRSLVSDPIFVMPCSVKSWHMTFDHALLISIEVKIKIYEFVLFLTNSCDISSQ